MCRKQLDKIFCWTASGELKIFKYRILRMGREEIYHAAYEIDSMICIYELLLEMSRKVPDGTLKAGIGFPGLLSFLYDRWMQYPGDSTEDIRGCLEEELMKISGDGRNEEGGEAA